MSLAYASLPRLPGLWLALGGALAFGIATGAHAVVALAIGVAAGLSLSGST